MDIAEIRKKAKKKKEEEALREAAKPPGVGELGQADPEKPDIDKHDLESEVGLPKEGPPEEIKERQADSDTVQSTALSEEELEIEASLLEKIAAEEAEAQAAKASGAEAQDEAQSRKLLKQEPEAEKPANGELESENPDLENHVAQEHAETPSEDDEQLEPVVDEEEDEEEEELVQAISFMLDKEEYAIEVEYLKEVVMNRVLTDVPRAPEGIMGVLSLRGTILPVLNLRGRLGLPPNNEGEQIIIVKDGDGYLGLIVDRVNHVVRVPRNSLEPAPTLNTIDEKLISALGRHERGTFILLNMENLLQRL